MEATLDPVVAWVTPYVSLLIAAAVLLARGYLTRGADDASPASPMSLARHPHSCRVSLRATLVATPIFLPPLLLCGVPFGFAVLLLSHGVRAGAIALSLLSLLMLAGWYAGLDLWWERLSEEHSHNATPPGHVELSTAVLLYALNAAMALIVFPLGT